MKRTTKTTICSMALSVALTASLGAGVSFAAPSDDKKAEAEAALTQLNDMQKTLEEAENTYYIAQQDHETATEKVEEAQSRIESASQKITDLQARLGARAKAMYRSGTSTYLDVLLGSSSFEEFANNLDMLDMMNKNDASMTQETKELRIEVEAQKAILEQQEAEAARAETEANNIRQNAEATVNNMAAVYDSLSAEAAELLEQERAAQAAAEAAAAQSVVEQSAANAANSASDSYSDEGSYDSGDSGYSNNQSYDAVTGNAIVDRAYSWVGRAEYVWGACSPGAFDCSGFVSYCLTGNYSRLGTTYTFLGWGAVSDPQPGDVAVNSGHCGIYIGNGQMIHCATYGVGVIVGPVQSGMVIVRY